MGEKLGSGNFKGVKLVRHLNRIFLNPPLISNSKFLHGLRPATLTKFLHSKSENLMLTGILAADYNLLIGLLFLAVFGQLNCGLVQSY